MMGLMRFCICWLTLWAVPSTCVAQPDALTRDRLLEWCAAFQSFGAVDVEWSYVAADVSAGELFRERLVTDWNTGLLIESGNNVRIRPDEAVVGDGDVSKARAQVILASGEALELHWLAELPSHRSYNRTVADLKAAHLSYLGHSEFVAAHLCAAELLENPHAAPTVVSAGGAERVRLAVSVFELEWVEGPDGLALARITCHRPDGAVAYEQVLADHAVDPDSGLLIAHSRETLVSSGRSGELSHANTAYLESVSFLDEVPSGSLSLDISGATTVDRATGMILNDQGRVIGPARGPNAPARVPWRFLTFIVGSGLIVAGAMWWYVRRK